MATVYRPLLQAELPSQAISFLALRLLGGRVPYDDHCESGQKRLECNDPGLLVRLTLQGKP